MTDPQQPTDEAGQQEDAYLGEDGIFDADRYYAEAHREPYPFHWAGEKWHMDNV